MATIHIRQIVNKNAHKENNTKWRKYCILWAIWNVQSVFLLHWQWLSPSGSLAHAALQRRQDCRNVRPFRCYKLSVERILRKYCNLSAILSYNFYATLYSTSNKATNIIKRHIDNRELLLTCILLWSHSLIFFRFIFCQYMVLFRFNTVIYVFLL